MKDFTIIISLLLFVVKRENFLMSVVWGTRQQMGNADCKK
jgi:hypothetical protein